MREERVFPFRTLELGLEERDLIASADRPEKVQASGPFAGHCIYWEPSAVSQVEKHHHHAKKPSSQVVLAKKAAALKAGAAKVQLSPSLRAANEAHIAEAALAPASGRDQHDGHNVHGAQARPADGEQTVQKPSSKQVSAARQATNVPVRLYGRHEIVAITGLSYPTIWSMMRGGAFPRSRIVGGKSKWISSEIDGWLTALPVRRLKGDDLVEAVA